MPPKRSAIKGRGREILAPPAKKTGKRRNGTSPPAKEARGQRMLRELQIDGTAALKGGEIVRRASKVQKFGGAIYEVADDGISWATTGKKRAAPATAASPPPPAKRPRRAVAASKPPLPAGLSKGKKRNDEYLGRDFAFLIEAVQSWKKAKFPARASGIGELATVLPYLESLERVGRRGIRVQAPVAGEEREEAPDAYELSEAEAKRFLQSTEAIDAPIFLTGQAIPLIDPENDSRPIEQVLEWFANDDEEHTASNFLVPLEDGRVPDLNVTTAQIKERFLNPPPPASKETLCPWNLPEIVYPTVTDTLPAFLRPPDCNLMRDLMRYLAEVEPEDICHTNCRRRRGLLSAEDCPLHILSAAEFITLQQVYRHFLGTIMLSEAGGFTGPHFDTFGFGTYIVCGEGEIGFAWCENVLARGETPSSKERWLFKVLRAGDAVYMDPGRYHLVFRLPRGTQTLGWATRVLRYCDLKRWVELLRLEVQEAAQGRISNDDYVLIWRGLLLSADRTIEQAKRTGRFERFGGEETVLAAEQLLKETEEALRPLLRELK